MTEEYCCEKFQKVHEMLRYADSLNEAMSSLDIDILEGDIIFCPYCGSKLNEEKSLKL